MSYAFLATKFDQKNCSVIQQGYNVVYKLFYNTVYNNHDVKGSPKPCILLLLDRIKTY